MKQIRKKILLKWLIRIPVYIILILIGLILILYAVLSVYIETTGPIVGPSSNEIKNLLKDEKFYFMVGGSIYESKGVQNKARIVKKRIEYEIDGGYYRVNYFLPTKSPNQKYIAYFKIHSYDQWHALCCGPNHLIQLVVLNLETGEEKLIFDTEEWDIRQMIDLPYGMQREQFDMRNLSMFSIGWSNDSENLYFNFVDSNYVYLKVSEDRYIPNRLVDRSGLIKIDTTYSTDVCRFFYPYGLSKEFTGQESTLCLVSKNGRFRFYKESREGVNAVWFIRGHDTTTNQDFRLTVLGRALYAE